jgi:hypothetical protein
MKVPLVPRRHLEPRQRGSRGRHYSFTVEERSEPWPRARSFIKAKINGTRISTCLVEGIMPPAMGFTSEPIPRSNKDWNGAGVVHGTAHNLETQFAIGLDAAV